ncbi:MAG: hypothetical protein FWH02_02605 [Oscillospiraceae bacterium]|nr:hypothetical protein [Oscillospiraceae bacterium]
MTIDEQISALRALGAQERDMDSLLEYTACAFSPRESSPDEDEFLEKWAPVFESARLLGAAAAINMHLAPPGLKVEFESPRSLTVELFPSIGGAIPIITTDSTADFERMVFYLIRKGKTDADIGRMGASFAYGKTNRFIILSKKPYRGLDADQMGLSDAEWREKSLIIRKYHECAHYFTKRFFGSSRNHLHDELIADFAGLYAAFREYRAEWFLKFFELSENCGGERGIMKIYTKGLAPSAVSVVERLAVLAAEKLEAWTKTDEFALMDDAGRISRLCEQGLLDFLA